MCRLSTHSGELRWKVYRELRQVKKVENEESDSLERFCGRTTIRRRIFNGY